ncbi:hypothetical protein Pyn_03543 [Prunus yedoensis var. nudiflora]|uniref:Uncharacterized protein n=1 Tax=Prunus yedoensis var. nudiflora TaxID=2094558 RepID=A0A314UVH8_PRUYE|nr:hypothetical protein Pyn_03543 [Prunus yedoensis var. nudiflora]
MHNDTASSTANGGLATSSQFKSQPRSDDAVFSSLYSAIFDRKPSLARYNESEPDASSNHPHRQLYHSLLVQDHQEMVNRCFTI